MSKPEPVCIFCGAPATCIGRGEEDKPDAPGTYACDECCGHGNEGAHCTLLDPNHVCAD